MSPHRKPERQQGSASLKGEGRLAARAMIVKAVGQKYGVRRSWRELEFTQLALQSLYPDAPPMGEPRKKLLREVNDWLANDPKWRAARFGKISRNTLARALKLPLWS